MLAAAAVLTAGIAALGWWMGSDGSTDCGGTAAQRVLCAQAGVALVERPSRGDRTVTFTTTSGGDVVVNAEDMIAADQRPTLVDLREGPSSSTGDPVLDAFVLAAQEYMRVPTAGKVEVDVVATEGVTPAVVAAWEAVAPTVGRLFGEDLEGVRLPLFVTDHRDADLDGINGLAAGRGCDLTDHVLERVEGKATGARYDMGMCGGNPALYLDLWQYLHLPGWDSPAALVQTISDELMTVWERRVQGGISGGENVPFWLYEGSQTLPWLLYSADRLAMPVFEDLAEPCRGVALTDLQWEGYVPGSQQSCPHQIGSAAIVLLVARVGVDPVLDYFRSDPARPHEDRFREMSGESSERFAARLGDWLKTRDSKGTRSTLVVSADGKAYRDFASRWLGN